MGWVGVQWGGVGACMCPVPSRPATPLLPATAYCCLLLAACCYLLRCCLLPAACYLLAANCCWLLQPPAASCCSLLPLLMPAAAACAAACRRRRPALPSSLSDFGIPISVCARWWPCDQARASRLPQTSAGRTSISTMSSVLQDELLASTSEARSVEFSPSPNRRETTRHCCGATIVAQTDEDEAPNAKAR